MQHREIPRAVADHREGLFGNGGEDQFARRSIRQGLAGLGVDDLGDEVVLENMQSVLRFNAFDGHSGTHHFAQAVDVHGLEVELAFNFLAHALGPGFGSENAGLELEVTEADAHIFCRLRDVQRVGRSAGEHGRAEILHDHHLAFGVAAGDRDDRGTQSFSTVVHPESAGEQTVAIGIVDDILPARAGGGQRTGHELGPGLNVAGGVAHHGGLAGGAGGGMDARNEVHGHGEHAIGVVVPQVALVGKRKFVQVRQDADVLGLHAGLVKPPAIKRNGVVDPR